MFRVTKIKKFFWIFCITLSLCFQPCLGETKPSQTSTKIKHSKQVVQKNKKKKQSTPQATHKSTKKSAKKTHHKKNHKSQPKRNKPQVATAADPVIDADLIETETKISQENAGIVSSVGKSIINVVYKTISSLRYSKYKLGGSQFDTERGVYIVDCSNFVDRLLEKATPHAYFSLVDATGVDTPATTHYYDFFSSLSDDPENHWYKIEDVEQLRSGDILVFRYKNNRGRETGGHVMVVMDKPEREEDIFFVRVADSASGAHSEDTRQPNTSGVGIGTLMLKANPKTGKPAAFAWGLNGYWNKNVNFAMARPLDADA